MARSQLAAWEKIASDWPLGRESLDDRCLRCKRCGKSVILLLDESFRPYQYDDAQWLALTVLHLRNHHAGLDPDRG